MILVECEETARPAFFSQPAGHRGCNPFVRNFRKTVEGGGRSVTTRRKKRETEQSESMPTLWKPPLQGRNSATLEFLGSWHAIRRPLQKNKSSLPGIPRRLREPSPWDRSVRITSRHPRVEENGLVQ